MTVQKGNFLEFTLLGPVTGASNTFRMVAAPKFKRADFSADNTGAYYDLNFDNDSTISLTSFRGTFEKAGVVETFAVDGVTADGTSSDGRRQYVCTFEVADDASTKLRGIKQDDDGTDSVDNVDSDLVIDSLSIGDLVKIPWDMSSANELYAAFENSVAETLVRYAEFQSYGGTQEVLLADGRNFFKVPEGYDNSDITDLSASVITAGTTGTVSVQVSTGGADMLTTPIQILSGETGSETNPTQPVVNPTYATVTENQILSIDVVGTTTTKPLGLIVLIQFTKNV